MGEIGVAEQLGSATLRLLCDECTLLVLRALENGPACAEDIEQHAPGVARWTARRRLQTLHDHGWASVGRDSGARLDCAERGGVYRLNEHGRRLLDICNTAVRCERLWCPPPQDGVPGMWAIKLAADDATRTIVRALADGSLTLSELRARTPELGRATLFRRLTTLVHAGVLVHHEHAGRYVLTDEARHLAIIPLRAGRAERAAARGARCSTLSDLPGAVHVLAPLAHVPRGLAGTCRWRFESGDVTESHVFLSVAAGHVAALGAPPLLPARADSRASARTWCDALLRGDASRIATTGDRALVSAIAAALSAALLQ